MTSVDIENQKVDAARAAAFIVASNPSADLAPFKAAFIAVGGTEKGFGAYLAEAQGLQKKHPEIFADSMQRRKAQMTALGVRM